MPVPSAPSLYAIALGSNRCGRAGAPRAVLAAAVAALGALGRVRAVSPTIETPPLGPGGRRFANAAALLESALPPDAMLAALKDVERRFGRRPGRRWGARVLDLDLILWSGGAWVSAGLVIPHPAWRQRGFVLAPLAAIAPDWRDPLTGRSVCQLARTCARARTGYVPLRVGP